jgi:hypothetical protein
MADHVFADSSAPGLRCSRSDDGAGTNQCPNDATAHVIWDVETMVNGLCCDFHLIEAQNRWGYDYSHPYDPVCSIAGALFLPDENRCVVAELLVDDRVAAAAEGAPQ